MSTKIMFIFFILLTGFFVGLPFIKDIPEQQIIVLRLWQILTFSGMLIFGKFTCDDYKKSLNG